MVSTKILQLMAKYASKVEKPFIYPEEAPIEPIQSTEEREEDKGGGGAEHGGGQADGGGECGVDSGR